MAAQTISVIIPTHGRADKLRRCLAAIGDQDIPAGVSVETIVAIDGDDSLDYDRAADAAPVRLLHLPRRGIAAARNAAIEAATGALLLFTNDDCYPDRNWIASHLAAQASRETPGMAVGQTLWREWDDPTVFDGLIRDTSMIFFFNRMAANGAYGHRHFWTCNASVPTALALEIGGFDERIRPYGFEDLEFAYRLEKAGHRGVRYCPDAVNVHDHRLAWQDYRNREACLGRMAACLAETNVDCFESLYGYRDAAAMRDDFRVWLARDAGDHAAADALLDTWLSRPLSEVGDWPTIREFLYAIHMPVKRRLFRAAFVEHFDLRHDAQWQDRLALGHSFP